MNQARQAFWRELNETITKRTDTPLSPTERDDSENDNWRRLPNIAASTGVGFDVRLDDQIMVWLIPRDRDIRDDVFAYLRTFKQEVDTEFDGNLEWNPDDQGEKIVLRRTDADIQQNHGDWDEYQDWLIENGEKFYTVFRPFLHDFEKR